MIRRSLCSDLLGQVFPIFCINCRKKDKAYLCKGCYRTMKAYANSSHCIVCSGTLLVLNGGVCAMCMRRDDVCYQESRSLLLYEGVAKEMVHKFKFDRQTYIVKIMSRMLVKKLGNYIKTFDVIVPVPSSGLQLVNRAFNPAAMLALYIAKITNVQYRYNWLVKVKHTKTQHSRTERQERLNNLKGAFALGKGVEKDRRVLLIDDVITTRGDYLRMF